MGIEVNDLIQTLGMQAKWYWYKTTIAYTEFIHQVGFVIRYGIPSFMPAKFNQKSILLGLMSAYMVRGWNQIFCLICRARCSFSHAFNWCHNSIFSDESNFRSHAQTRYTFTYFKWEFLPFLIWFCNVLLPTYFLGMPWWWCTCLNSASISQCIDSKLTNIFRTSKCENYCNVLMNVKWNV